MFDVLSAAHALLDVSAHIRAGAAIALV